MSALAAVPADPGQRAEPLQIVSFRPPVSMYRALAAIAKREHRSIAAQVLLYVSQAIEREQGGEAIASGGESAAFCSAEE